MGLACTARSGSAHEALAFGLCGGHIWSPICSLETMAHGGVCMQKIFLGQLCFYIQSEVPGPCQTLRSLGRATSRRGWVQQTLLLRLLPSAWLGWGAGGDLRHGRVFAQGLPTSALGCW